eukprot:IDg20878t1
MLAPLLAGALLRSGLLVSASSVLPLFLRESCVAILIFKWGVFLARVGVHLNKLLLAVLSSLVAPRVLQPWLVSFLPVVCTSPGRFRNMASMPSVRLIDTP